MHNVSLRKYISKSLTCRMGGCKQRFRALSDGKLLNTRLLKGMYTFTYKTLSPKSQLKQ